MAFFFRFIKSICILLSNLVSDQLQVKIDSHKAQPILIQSFSLYLLNKTIKNQIIMKKLLRKDLSTILGSGINGCHSNGDSAYCWTDCECTYGKACEMPDDGNPGSCVSVGSPGGGGNPGGGCPPGMICEEEPF